MFNLITQAQPPLKFIQPAFNPLVWSIARSLLPLWLRYRQQITEVRINNAEVLVELYRQFQAGQTRFLLAFRHPSTDDPLCIAHLLWHQLPQIARQQGNPLQLPVHAHFIYDRGIPLWAGETVGWLIAQLAGTPIRRGTVDRMGLRSIRDLFIHGRFPLAAAPEGATNGHNEIVSPLEPGIAQFGFWCLEDLNKESRSEQVFLVPLGIKYSFDKPPWKSLEQILTQLEADSGLRNKRETDEQTMMKLQDGVSPTDKQQAVLYDRLYHLGEHLLLLMENFYKKFYEPILPTEVTHELNANEQLANRLQALLNAALNVAEQAFGLKSKGTIPERCRRIEQASWERIYREDVSEMEALSPVEKGLADLIALEANLRLWHMRLVETFVSVTGRYVDEKPTVERFADTILLLWKMVNQIKGKSSNKVPYLGLKQAQLTVGQPLLVSERWDEYKSNRRLAVASLTQDLQSALEEMIE